ncbi:hypothetical protein [Poseidonocella sp. HB161398]|uniref:hypothetical protein n=1 Tax=Poseidonocella sp. HB161398 TaxID=2320855 RepID=UPI00110803ED|nr:hypothetical protein [Poseidonocella sp. HB161398]
MAAVPRIGGGAGGAVHLARGLEIGRRDPVPGHRLAGKADGLPVQRDLRPVAAAAGIVLGGQLVRQVDHEAGIAPGGAFADLPRLQQENVQRRIELQQAPPTTTISALRSASSGGSGARAGRIAFQPAGPASFGRGLAEKRVVTDGVLPDGERWRKVRRRQGTGPPPEEPGQRPGHPGPDSLPRKTQCAQPGCAGVLSACHSAGFASEIGPGRK